ncbi:helix-turn-helix domain-containing protein [Candidatus Kaiserbacteria bacterium]|nr:helix-turn-helix domain-containing protein [Candidatus Kaiserbacteria bacterium]
MASNLKAMRFSQAGAYLGVPQKALENFVKAGEIVREKAGRYWMTDRAELDRWKNDYTTRSVLLSEEEYRKCLDFAIRSYYGGFAMTNFGTRTQRDVGQFLFNSVQGKLGEIGLRKFLNEKFKIKITLDFDVRGVVVGQDISEVQRGRIVNPPKMRVGIKSTKERNMFLAVPQSEVEQPERSSDIYILVRVALPSDHFLRFARTFEPLSNIRTSIPEFEPIRAEVAGFVYKEDLQGPAQQVLGQDLAKPNYFCHSGALKKSDSDWKSLIEQL